MNIYKERGQWYVAVTGYGEDHTAYSSGPYPAPPRVVAAFQSGIEIVMQVGSDTGLDILLLPWSESAQEFPAVFPFFPRWSK